jgi:hypothetical protein
MVRQHGLNVIHKESEDDYGLPRDLTIDILENEQYLLVIYLSSDFQSLWLLPQEFLCWRINCIWNCKKFGQADGGDKRSSRRAIPYSRCWG